MSQLQQVASSSIGRSSKSCKLTWADFVSSVLQITIQAYQLMFTDQIAKIDWEENVFTERLGVDYIRPLAFDRDLPIRVSVRNKIHTEAMREGTQPTIQAKEIDMMLFDVWERNYHRKYFAWEAKRVGDKRVDLKYNNLNSEYVNEAIYRFIEGDYSDGLEDAGVLGYVLAGMVDNIVKDINGSMGNIRNKPALPASNFLQLASPVSSFQDIFRSSHSRSEGTLFCLQHLFLTFNLDNCFPKEITIESYSHASFACHSQLFLVVGVWM
ncbi:MAG: hypothetical protein GY759_17910 [Chloroflexi bacterium]|nr:hypothetical protein [Chloroflexota bacterium]